MNLAMAVPRTPVPFKNFNVAIGPMGQLSPMSNAVHTQVVRFLDGMMNGQPAGFKPYKYAASPAEIRQGVCWGLTTHSGPQKIGGTGSCKAECCNPGLMIKFLDAPDQLRGDHLWGGSEGGGNNPGDQPRVGGSPLNDAEHKDYLKFIGSEPLPTLKEQKDRAKIELRRLVIAHRDHFSKVPVDLEKNSSAKYEREHFVSDLRTNGTNNAWVKIGMAKLVDGTDEPSDNVPVLRKIAYASWREVHDQFEADEIVCSPKTVIEHWVSRVDDIGRVGLELGSFRWVMEEDVDTDDIADADPLWGIKTGDGIRHIDTLPKFNIRTNRSFWSEAFGR